MRCRHEKVLCCTIDRNVNWCNHIGRQFWRIDLSCSYDLPIPFLCIFTEEKSSLMWPNAEMFIKALFIKVKNHRLPNCPSKCQWILWINLKSLIEMKSCKMLCFYHLHEKSEHKIVCVHVLLYMNVWNKV